MTTNAIGNMLGNNCGIWKRSEEQCESKNLCPRSPS